MTQLHIKYPDLTVKSTPLTKETLVIGRRPFCDIVLSNNAVSREHARLYCESSIWKIEDLRSRNGVWINGRRIDKPTELKDGDSIQIGVYNMTIQDDTNARGNKTSKKESVSTDDFSWSEEEVDPSSFQSRIELGSSRGARERAKSGESASKYEREISLLEERTNALLEFARIVGKSQDWREQTPSILENLLTLFPKADSACLLICEPSETEPNKSIWKTLGYRLRDESDTSPYRISRAIIHHVARSHEAVLSVSPRSDLRFEGSDSIFKSQIESVMAVPLYDDANRRLMGVFQLDARKNGKRFANSDLSTFVTIVNQIAVYIENQLYRAKWAKEKEAENELRAAIQVQRCLLPAEAPKIDRYDFYDLYRPAESVGGDYYDYIPLSDGSIAFVLGDVTGHGFASSLVMVNFASETRNCLAMEKTRVGAFQRLNRFIYERYQQTFFVTLVMLVLEPETGTIHLLNAGHPAPVVSKRNGDVERIGVGLHGTMLGVKRDEVYSESVYQLQEGEAISIMSDGIADTMNSSDERFTDERVLEGLKNPEGLDAVHLGRRLENQLRAFAGSSVQNDDQCLVIIRRT